MKKIRRSQRKHLAKSYKKHLAKSYKKHLRKTYKKHLRKTYKGGVVGEKHARDDDGLDIGSKSMRVRDEDIVARIANNKRKALAYAQRGMVDELRDMIDLGLIQPDMTFTGPRFRDQNGVVFVDDQWTLLHFAAYGNKTRTVKMLLEKGVPADVRTTRSGQTPAQLAKRAGQRRAAEMLEAWPNDPPPDPPLQPLAPGEEF